MSETRRVNGFALAKGDSVEVTGSKSKVDDSEILLAGEVKKGAKTVTLRNAPRHSRVVVESSGLVS